MPYQRRYSSAPRGKPASSYPKTYKKKYVKKYKTSNNLIAAKTPQIGTSFSLRSMPLFPTRVMKRLRYSTPFYLTSSSGAVATYIISANGLYDPDITGTGHQPMGFDQMMLFYNHYCVTWAKITIIANNQSTTVPCTVVVRYDASGVPITVSDRILEAGGCVSTHLDVFGSTASMKELSLVVNIPKLQGIPLETVISDPSLTGDSLGNPIEQSYFHISLFQTFGLTVSSVNFDIIVDYISYFSEPKTPTQS